ncbi:MAG: LacI family DNA-binding transcriptional regulator [Treponema sp.]|jgi:LacI family transcriptional regulator|nr:LacI family DNA-binding transcriptional regulator [Treponema sp.]
MQPRIIDIAKMAEVSPSAVSLALNNKTGVSTEVRQRIINIAEELGYKTVSSGAQYRASGNATIRLLKIAKHGHIVNERHNAFITEYLEGIERGAKKRQCKLEVSFFNKAPIEEIIDSQRGTAADGLIVLGTELNAHELDFFTALPGPVVFIDTYFPLAVFDCVDIDNADGVFRSVQYLYKCGHRSIGLVRSAYETRNFKMREIGFREAMEYFSLPVQESCIVSVDPAYDQCCVDMKKYLKKAKTLPTAFFCMNDIIAYGCIKALGDQGYTIPDDVSIIGFDDLPSSSITGPPLTTVKVSARQIGERALERVFDTINGIGQSSPEKILVAGNLIIRDSVKKL